jgi:hypothetical protein
MIAHFLLPQFKQNHDLGRHASGQLAGQWTFPASGGFV